MVLACSLFRNAGWQLNDAGFGTLFLRNKKTNIPIGLVSVLWGKKEKREKE